MELRRRRHGRFLRLLERPGFRLLFLSTFASSFGTLLAAVALAVDVKDRTNSGLWISALMVVEFLPTIIVGLVFGPLLDRFSRRGLMVRKTWRHPASPDRRRRWQWARRSACNCATRLVCARGQR